MYVPPHTLFSEKHGQHSTVALADHLPSIICPSAAQIQAYLKQLNGQGTVPHIYIKQQFIGGCSDLQKLPGNELQKRIAA